MIRSGRRLLLRLAVSATAFVVLMIVVDAGAVADSLEGLRPTWVLAALAVSVAQVAASAWRWRYTAGRLGIELPFGRAFGEYYLASFLNQVLPGGVLGDISRAWRHARSARIGVGGGAPAPLRSIHAVVLERLSGQVVMTFLAVLSAAVLGGVRALAVVAIALAAGFVLLHAAGRYGRLPGATDLLADARAALGGAALPVQMATSLLVVISYLVVYVMAARAVGVTTPTGALLPLLAPVLVTMLLPVTVAGWGVREGAAAALWGAVGLTPEDGVAISVAYGLLVLVSTLPGGAIVFLTLWRGRAPDRAARRSPFGTSETADAAPRPTTRSSGG
jgi:glycosyltransferase 2 family protein